MTDTTAPVVTGPAMQDPTYAGPCPRCGGAIPNDAEPGAYPGALSRVDNLTYVCSDCGGLEALFQWFNKGEPLPNVYTPLRAAPVKGAEVAK